MVAGLFQLLAVRSGYAKLLESHIRTCRTYLHFGDGKWPHHVIFHLIILRLGLDRLRGCHVCARMGERRVTHLPLAAPTNTVHAPKFCRTWHAPRFLIPSQPGGPRGSPRLFHAQSQFIGEHKQPDQHNYWVRLAGPA